MSIPSDELTRLTANLLLLNPKSKEYKKQREYIKSEDYGIMHDQKSDPEEVAQIMGWDCKHCGGLRIPTQYQTRPPGIPGLGFWVRPTSHECYKEKEFEQRAKTAENLRIAHAAKSATQRRFENAGLVGRLADCTFENFTLRGNWQKAMDLKAQVNQYETLLLSGQLTEKNWLVMAGEVGTGKSHLAAAVVHDVLTAGKSAYFRVWTKYLKRIQASWENRGQENRETESDIQAELERGWLVVIDDLDKRKPSEWAKGVLYTFLNERYNKKLPTIITLNTALRARDPLAPGRLALQEIMGGAVLDRAIHAMWKYLEFNGPSYRSRIKMNN